MNDISEKTRRGLSQQICDFEIRVIHANSAQAAACRASEKKMWEFNHITEFVYANPEPGDVIVASLGQRTRGEFVAGFGESQVPIGDVEVVSRHILRRGEIVARTGFYPGFEEIRI